MEKIVKDYIKPGIKVNEFTSRNETMQLQWSNDTTDEQLDIDPRPDDPFDPSHQGAKSNVWGE